MLWNDKRTPPGVFTDSRTGMQQTGFAPAPVGGPFGPPRPSASVGTRYAATMNAQRPSQTLGERLMNRGNAGTGMSIATKRGNRLRAAGKLNPLK